MDGGARRAAVHGVAEADTTERLHFHFSLSCIGEGNGNPLQCSCLENPRGGGTWWADVYGVTQSQTRLKWLSISRLSTTEHMHRRLWGFKRGASDPGLRLGMLDQHSSAGFRSRVQSFKTFNSLLTGVFLQKLMPMAGDFYFGWPQLNCYFTNTLWVIIFNSYTWHTCKVFQFFVKHCFQSTPPGSSPRRIQGNPKEKRRRRLI